MPHPKAGEEGWDEYKAKAYARQKKRMEDPEYRAYVYARRRASQAKLKAKRAAEKAANDE